MTQLESFSSCKQKNLLPSARKLKLGQSCLSLDKYAVTKGLNNNIIIEDDSHIYYRFCLPQQDLLLA